MTREEKAQEFARNCAEYNNLPVEVEHLLHTAFIAGYNEREDEGKNPWHKASEELPEEKGMYLVWIVEYNHPVTMLWGDYGWDNPLQDAVTHWMEIPEIKED